MNCTGNVNFSVLGVGMEIYIGNWNIDVLTVGME